MPLTVPWNLRVNQVRALPPRLKEDLGPPCAAPAQLRRLPDGHPRKDTVPPRSSALTVRGLASPGAASRQVCGQHAARRDCRRKPPRTAPHRHPDEAPDRSAAATTAAVVTGREPDRKCIASPLHVGFGRGLVPLVPVERCCRIQQVGGTDQTTRLGYVTDLGQVADRVLATQHLPAHAETFEHGRHPSPCASLLREPSLVNRLRALPPSLQENLRQPPAGRRAFGHGITGTRGPLITSILASAKMLRIESPLQVRLRW